MFINNIFNSYVVLCEDFFLLLVLLMLSLFREFNIGNNFLVDNPTQYQQVMNSDNWIQGDLYLRSETYS